MNKSLVSTSKGTIQTGQYECEGHTVYFIINDDNIVRVNLLYEAQGHVSTHVFELNLDQAIEYQEKLIRLGYDKVS
tara:strand:+ start:401 stop:628 length:228 start_codon:yes stop_codon:yes gene_type:complete